MKPLLLFLLLFPFFFSFAQSLDYISVRTRKDRVVKNFYTGSDILLQTTEYAYLQGPIKAVRNDSVFLTIYDVRMVQTTYGGFIRDTITTTVVGLSYKEIKRVYLNRRRSFTQRNGPNLLMIGGAGYFALNVLNGAYFGESLASRDKVKRLSISAGLFGLGFLLQKLFRSDGFSKPSQKIVYVNLSAKKV